MITHRLLKMMRGENKKSRRDQTPVVLARVGLLVNGSPGDWPEYPLFSHPIIFNFSERQLYLQDAIWPGIISFINANARC
jgi:hypothetical protein